MKDFYLPPDKAREREGIEGGDREREREKRIEASSQNGSVGIPHKVKDPSRPNIHGGGLPFRDHFQQFKQHRDSRKLSLWINLEAKANPWPRKTG
jgi:hypothetical protein